MPWGPLINSEICAIHAAVVPTLNGDGEVIYFGGDEHSPPALLANTIDKSRRFNCRTEAITYVQSPPADLFCCGHAFMADGRLLIGGGTVTFEAEAPGEHGMLGHFTAERRCWAYNPFAPGFSEVARFGPEPGREMNDTGGGRWYPTILTLPNGQLLAVGGHPAGDDTRHENDTPERYLPATNSWTRMPALPGVGGYARMHVTPTDGLVLVVDSVGGTMRYNPWTGAATVVTAGPTGGAISSVILPLLPEENYRTRILVTGAVQPKKLDLGATIPSWQNAGARVGSAAGKVRNNSGAVLLPTGKVVVVGGAEDRTNDATGVQAPELYDPVTDSWQTIEEPAQQVRNYHSTMLLLPDGRVWTAGSNVNSARTEGGVERRVLNIEIFTPTYPAGTRPRISDCPSSVAYGQQFTVRSPEAASIRRAALIRCGSMTHSINLDQRYIGLPITGREGTALTLTAPPHGAVAPPGHYMLFLIDEGGRPCQYARFIRVGGAMYVITDRSHFSEMEVNTMGSPATFYDAFYVIMDGFLSGDAGLPNGPSISFQWGSGAGAVPGMNARLENTLFESGSTSPGVGQKIVLVYSIRFTNAAAFSTLGPTETRPVSIIVQRGGHETRGSVTLFKRKNPYMVDGNPHWLSLDVRVLQIAQDQTFAGVMQDADVNAPHTFLDGVLAELRARPEGGTHPFERDLNTDQAESPLELAPVLSGKKIYNYAFARVRYRAPMGQNAQNVRVFFRMFTTAAASMEFRPSTYPVHTTGSTVRPLIGLAGNEVASIPFFAAARAGNLELQNDPQNVRTLNGTGSEDVEYFGCWLDLNQPSADIYRREPNANGTGGTGPLLSIQEHIIDQHQCMVAEVNFAEDPIPPGATPGDNDNLAQRNLVIVKSDNPGGGDGHLVQHTFELRPSPVWPKLPETLPVLSVQPTVLVPELVHGHHVVEAKAVTTELSERLMHDQLLVRWNNLPRDSMARFYWPDVDIRELLEVASLKPSAGMCRLVDSHTVECRVGDVTLLPIPGNRVTNIPGLLSVQLPDTVKEGQLFKISLHQISGTHGKIMGAFQFTIPVSRGPLLLAAEEHRLALLRHRASVLAPGNRWVPVFGRYLDEIAARVRAFGGNPDLIVASPDGTGGRWSGSEVPDKSGVRVTGKVAEILYDCFGDFQGFVLEPCGGTRHIFHTREKSMEELVHRACRQRARLTVIQHNAAGHQLAQIIWHCT
jgi:Domain of unknown function (DUF1929)